MKKIFILLKLLETSKKESEKEVIETYLQNYDYSTLDENERELIINFLIGKEQPKKLVEDKKEEKEQKEEGVKEALELGKTLQTYKLKEQVPSNLIVEYKNVLDKLKTGEIVNENVRKLFSSIRYSWVRSKGWETEKNKSQQPNKEELLNQVKQISLIAKEWIKNNE